MFDNINGRLAKDAIFTIRHSWLHSDGNEYAYEGKELKNYLKNRDNDINKKNKVIGSILAGAIGDALGYKIEFKRNVKSDEVTDFDDTGIISDDTQMTLFTAMALIYKDIVRDATYKDVFYNSYLDWFDTQNNKKSEGRISNLNKIDELNVCRAPGNTCLSALGSGNIGTVENPINNSKGCGAIMRIAPIGLYIDNPVEAGKVAITASAITHGNILGYTSSCILAVLLNLKLNNPKKPLKKLVYKSIKIFKKEYSSIQQSEEIKYMLKLLSKAIHLSGKNINDQTAINMLGEGWVAEETLAIAIYSCLKHSNNIKDTLICAINHDGDSDSTGAVAGNIIGAYLGLENIPEEYTKKLELNNLIITIAGYISKDLNFLKNSNNESSCLFPGKLEKYKKENKDSNNDISLEEIKNAINNK